MPFQISLTIEFTPDYRCNERNREEEKYPTVQAMMKMRPGARFGMAVATAGDVSLIPFKNRAWKRVTL